MKRTYNINLNGQAFCIDEDACAQLQRYIERLEQHYLPEKDGKEIMADIETRIAELLRDFLRERHREVVSQEEVGRAIGILGEPDAIIDGDNQPAGTPPEKIKRKLYRDTEFSMIGGVASGLGIYFDLPRAGVRLAFVLLLILFGATFWIYIILWIVIPKAATARQKAEMRGERIHVSDIERNIRNACHRPVTPGR